MVPRGLWTERHLPNTYYASLATAFELDLRSWVFFSFSKLEYLFSWLYINEGYILNKIKHSEIDLVDCKHLPYAYPKEINAVNNLFGMHFQIIYVWYSEKNINQCTW